MNEKKFVDGLIVKPPREQAPHFVKCVISIKRQELGNWLRQESDDWINLDVKVAKSGKWYAEVNTWKPQAGKFEDRGWTEPEAKNDFDDDIPF